MTTRKKSHGPTITSAEFFKGQPQLSFGSVLRAWRLGEELSQAEMARRLGLSRANLCDLEKGRKLPSPGRALRIARKLGMVEAHVIELVLQDLLRHEQVNLRVSVAA